MLCNGFKIKHLGRWWVECPENTTWILVVESIFDVFCRHAGLCLVVHHAVEESRTANGNPTATVNLFLSVWFSLPIFYGFLFDGYNGKIVVFLVPLMSLCLSLPPTGLTLHSPICSWFVASLTGISKFYTSCHLLLSPPSPSISLTSLTL